MSSFKTCIRTHHSLKTYSMHLTPHIIEELCSAPLGFVNVNVSVGFMGLEGKV